MKCRLGHPASSAFFADKLECSITGCNILTCRPAVTKYSSIRILSIYLVYSASFQNTHSNCEFTDGNGSVNSKDECIVRDALSLDKRSKQTTRRKKVASVTVPLFPVIRRCCSADVKIFVVYFTFATQKLTKKTPKHFANSSSFQHSRTLTH